MDIFSKALGDLKKFDPKGIAASPISTLIPKSVQQSLSGAKKGLEALTNGTAEAQAGIATAAAASPNASSDETIPVGAEIVSVAREDTRLRLTPYPTAYKQVLGVNDPTLNLLAILYDTNGLLFPYTPNITVSQSVNWDPMALVHTNFDVQNYQRTPSVTISVSGIFTTQNQREGEYLMAVLHFLRVVTKSYFGIKDAASAKAGIPPPVLNLRGYGSTMFAGLPVVIKSYNYTLDETIDQTVFFARNGESARLPAKMIISLELGVQTNPNKQRNDFSLDEFRLGNASMRGFY